MRYFPGKCNVNNGLRVLTGALRGQIDCKSQLAVPVDGHNSRSDSKCRGAEIVMRSAFVKPGAKPSIGASQRLGFVE